jgi:hypothetical protein
VKHELAFRLIGDQLEWSDADFAREFRELQLMISYKYDAYQGFQPGTRFHVALLNWLSQFTDLEERRTAYKFAKNQLIFISQREIHHLVGLMMPEIEREARLLVAEQMNVPLYQTYIDENLKLRLEQFQRRSLFVGLSDGARIDVFRRYNEGRVSNEQVVAFSEISDDKWNSLHKELCKDCCKKSWGEECNLFEAVCLVDDFSGSGSSLLRFDEDEQKWKGKIAKFHKANVGRIGKLLTQSCHVHIHHYLASHKAKEQIEKDLAKFALDHTEFKYSTSFSYVLSPHIVITDGFDDPFLAVIKSRYDKSIEDEHTKTDIWFGYKQCGLPLVLEHNTPNNSIALLWATTTKEDLPADKRMKPLFARRKRHSSNG